MSAAEKARIAHCLISSLDQPADENVDAQWIKLTQKRLAELENGSVKPGVLGIYKTKDHNLPVVIDLFRGR
jgi:hypothetical protein